MGLALSVFVVSRGEERLLLTHGDRPPRVLEALSGEVSLSRYVPSLVSADAADVRVGLLWGAVLALLLVLDRVALKSDRADALFRGLGLPLMLLLGLGALVDGWARPPGVAGTAAGLEATPGTGSRPGGALSSRAAGASAGPGRPRRARQG
jgi:hypothetical protein